MTIRTTANSRAAKAKGAVHEKHVADFYKANGFPHAERKAKRGQFDAGDITGVVALTVEVKSWAAYRPTLWLKELEVERQNNGTEYGVVHFKLAGSTKAPVLINEDMWAKILAIPGVKEAFDGTA